MFGDGFEQSTILRTGPDGLTRVGTRRSWPSGSPGSSRPYAAELLVLKRWSEFHEKALGFAKLGSVSVLTGQGVAPTAAVQPEPHSQRVKTGRRELATIARRFMHKAVNCRFLDDERWPHPGARATRQ
jgi:hypothetical protein